MNTATMMLHVPPLVLAVALGALLLAVACFTLRWIVCRRQTRNGCAHRVGEKAARSAVKSRVLSLARPHSRIGEPPPVTQETRQPARPNTWLRQMTLPSNDKPLASVLVADDDVYVNHWLSLRLGELGLDVVATTDAVNALLGAERFHPDLIVLDINMPTGSGAAVCELLATNEELRGIPVIMYTGVADAKIRYRCQSLGARYVMKEPGSWNCLRSHVCELLGLPPAHESAANHAQRLPRAIPDDERRSRGAVATHAALPGA